MYSLEDKVAVVTGGANGIGGSLVQDLLKEGCKFVAIVDLNEEAGKSLELKLNAEFGKNRAEFMKCDVTVDEQLFGAVDKTIKEHGYIDLFVNNAGVADESPKNYKNLIAINYTALVTGTLKAFEVMRKDRNGRGGTIINVSSISALDIVYPTIFIYSGSKAAVLLFSCNIGKEELYAQTNVRVITVCFGATETSIFNSLSLFDDELNREKNNVVQQYHMQTVQSASRGMIDAYKKGKSGGVWLSECDEPAVDITESVYKAYNILSKNLKSYVDNTANPQSGKDL